MSSALVLKFLIIASSNFLCNANAQSSHLASSSNNHHPSSSSSININSHSHNTHHNSAILLSDWQRNLEAHLSRVVLRLDQLELRMGRVQSLIQMRFDNIESGYTTTKLRMDVWGSDLNRIEEQLSRKWKILESKFDTALANIDAKLENKLTTIQRDNRRYQEYITSQVTSSLNSVAVAQDKVGEKVKTYKDEVNASLDVLKVTAKNFTSNQASSTTALVKNSDKILNILQEFVSNSSHCQGSRENHHSRQGGGPTSEISSSSSPTTFSSHHHRGPTPELHNNQTTLQYHLLVNKVTNMFEDLIRRSGNVDGVLKDILSIANSTRKDVHDGFRALSSPSSHSSNRNSHSRSSSSSYHSPNSGGGSSSEAMSSIIVEALASVDSMSSALGRKITEFSQSMDERLEMVGMSINEFLDSCHRIQGGEEALEIRMAEILEKLLDTVENSTKTGTELWTSVATSIRGESRNSTNFCLSSATQNHHYYIHSGIMNNSETGRVTKVPSGVILLLPVNISSHNNESFLFNRNSPILSISNNIDSLLQHSGNKVAKVTKEVGESDDGDVGGESILQTKVGNIEEDEEDDEEDGGQTVNGTPFQPHSGDGGGAGGTSSQGGYNGQEDFDDTGTEGEESGEEETTIFPNINSNSRNTNPHPTQHYHGGYRRPTPLSLSPSSSSPTRRPTTITTSDLRSSSSGGGGADVEMTEQDKNSLWESLKGLSQPST